MLAQLLELGMAEVIVVAYLVMSRANDGLHVRDVAADVAVYGGYAAVSRGELLSFRGPVPEVKVPNKEHTEYFQKVRSRTPSGGEDL